MILLFRQSADQRAPGPTTNWSSKKSGLAVGRGFHSASIWKASDTEKPAVAPESAELPGTSQMEPAGIEPATSCLQSRRSPTELWPRAGIECRGVDLELRTAEGARPAPNLAPLNYGGGERFSVEIEVSRRTLLEPQAVVLGSILEELRRRPRDTPPPPTMRDRNRDVSAACRLQRQARRRRRTRPFPRHRMLVLAVLAVPPASEGASSGATLSLRRSPPNGEVHARLRVQKGRRLGGFAL